ncbi:2-hydroxyacyl-CoA dehydratase subunit D [Chloroflexota bacterium]
MPDKSVMGKGLAVVDKYYQAYGNRVRELKADNQKIVGYLSMFVPLEMISAAGFLPFRIKGDVKEPITKADTLMETIVCPFVRSGFDLMLKSKYEFIDGMAIPHTCDSVGRTYGIWHSALNLSYFHFIDVPHITDAPSLEFFKAELGTFKKSLESFAGKNISDDSLAQAIRSYNENRAKMRELYELRRANPPLISGPEMLKVQVAVMGIPVAESTELIDEVIREVKEREVTAGRNLPRIMVIGAQIDDTAFMDIVDGSGARVVMDDISIGSKVYWADVDTAKDPLDGIAERYLFGIKHPRTYIETEGTYQDNLEARFGHIGRFIRDFGVEGVIIYVYRYCDPYGFEVPAMKSYIEATGVPVLYLEDEYSMGTIGRLKTRVEAFLEMIV